MADLSDSHDPPRTLLVIDDDAIMREILSAVLAMEGYTVHLAESGEEALAFLSDARAKIDVILADLHMPGVQGAELAARLEAARAPGTLLIGMSGSRPSVEEVGLYGAFLDKPFAVTEFTQAVRAAAGETLSNALAEASGPGGTAVLDETIYARLAAMLAPAQLRELYRITIADVLRRIEIMREALKCADIEACRREAHSIKGGCGMVGATELSALATAVETGSAVDNLLFAENGPPFADFAAACARLQGMLDARF
jgi:CheY-like chemotaxis protein/HPt (histidine-containing phosphotransfer) domain-containing protein